MRFRELVAVMPGNKRRPELRQGQDGQLHELDPFHRGREQWEGERIDHVFRIVQNDCAEPQVIMPFVILDCSIEAIEAIGLAGRPIEIVHHHAYARIAASAEVRRARGFRVVAIAADIEPQPVLRPRGAGVSDRSRYHPRFLPRGNKHGPALGQRRPLQRFPVNTRRGRPPGCAQPDVDDIDRELVDGSDQEKGAGKQKKLVLHQHEPIARRHLRDH